MLQGECQYHIWQQEPNLHERLHTQWDNSQLVMSKLVKDSKAKSHDEPVALVSNR